jgi:hypothetical protein
MTSTPAGEFLTRWTVRAAFGLYVAAIAWRLQAGSSPGRRSRTARGLWTLACLAFAAHVALAFHFFHGWSHADAYRQTARQTAELTGVESGLGLYLNYTFLAAWAADVALAWRRGDGGGGGAGRLRRVASAALHAFMAFMWFNATVVFPTGPTRWAGLVAFGLLAAMLLASQRRRRRHPPLASAAPGGGA